MELWIIFCFFEFAAYLFTGFKVEPIIIQIILLGLNIYTLYGLITGITFGAAYFLLQRIKKNRINEKKVLSITATIFISTLMFMNTFDLLQRHAGIKFSRQIDFFSIIGIGAINFLIALGIYFFLQKIHYENKQGIHAISLSICFSVLITGGYIINNYFFPEILNWQSNLINILFFLSIILFYYLLNKFLKIINKNKYGRTFYFQRPVYYTLLILYLASFCVIVFLGDSQSSLSGKNIHKNIQNSDVNNFSESLNVILITMDALRSDHLSCYGYQNVKTPSIDSIAERGVLFNRAISQSPWTIPSFASMFTSYNPSVHDGGRILCKGGERLITSIIPDIPVLPEILQEKGFVTGAFISNTHLCPAYGFARGFDDYFNFDHKANKESLTCFLYLRIWGKLRGDRYDYNYGKTRSGVITEKAKEWIESHVKTPFFLWIHYLDPHLPYEGYKESKIFKKPIYNNVRNRMDTLLGDNVFSSLVRSGTINLNSLERRLLVELYDEEITETDEYIGNVLKKLKELNMEDTTLIIFSSDHGEEFFDHNNFEHGHSLFEELIRVPLIFQYPKKLQSKIINKQVRLIDIMPTILELLNISLQDEIAGKSLLPLMNSQDDKIEIPPAISEYLLYFEERKSLRTENFKLIFYPESKKTELYNIEKDPLEITNLDAVNPETSETLYERLDSLIDYSIGLKNRLTRGKTSNVINPDKMLLERLRALGYINAGSSR
ncbi:MAG: sulfatase-like hydrolase/transferase [Candidatus Thorarchaeota archaeon]